MHGAVVIFSRAVRALLLLEPGLEECAPRIATGRVSGKTLPKGQWAVKRAARLRTVWKQVRSERSLGASCLRALEGFDIYSE